MRFSVLNSSSSGNATYLETNKYKILLDAAISPKMLAAKLEQIGVSQKSIDYIFITHEHYDHVSCLLSLFKIFDTKIVLTQGTYDSLSDNIKSKISPINFIVIKQNDEIIIDGLKINSFKTNHDAKEPVGYMFTEDNKSLVYLTDTGVFDPIDLIKNKDAYIIESNHEVKMLELSNRPWALIQRIESNIGHMSNEYSANLFDLLKGDKTKNVVLFHLSSECNSNELAMFAYENVLKNTNIKLTISDKVNPINLIEV